MLAGINRSQTSQQRSLTQNYATYNEKKLILKTQVLSPHQLAEEGPWISTAAIAHDWGTPIKLFCSVRGKKSNNFSLKFTRFGNCRLRHLQELLQGSSGVPPNPGFILLALQYSQMICYFSKTPLRSWAELHTGRTCPWHSFQHFIN